VGSGGSVDHRNFEGVRDEQGFKGCRCSHTRSIATPLLVDLPSECVVATPLIGNLNTWRS
jgi:hypothetical protein